MGVYVNVCARVLLLDIRTGRRTRFNSPREFPRSFRHGRVRRGCTAGIGIKIRELRECRSISIINRVMRRELSALQRAVIAGKTFTKSSTRERNVQLRGRRYTLRGILEFPSRKRTFKLGRDLIHLNCYINQKVVHRS